jgi:Zn-dependent metalloprotease
MRKVVSVLSVLLLLAIAIVGASTANAANNPASSGSTAASMSRTPVSAEDGERIARDFVIANASRYGVSADDLSGLRVTDNYADSISGSRYVYFQQTVNGIGLSNAVINVTVLPNGNVLFVGNRTVANIAAKATVTEPTLTQSQAIAAAANALGLTYTASSVTEASSVAGSERAATFSVAIFLWKASPLNCRTNPPKVVSCCRGT